MREVLLVIFAVISYQSSAQITSGTVIVLNFTEDKLIVAADSRGSHINRDRPPDDSQCKLAQFNHKLLFASTGAAGYIRRDTRDTTPGWENTVVARDAVRETFKRQHGKIDIESASAAWAQKLISNWSVLYGNNRPLVIKAAEAGHGVITAGFFAQAKKSKIAWILALITFDSSRAQPISALPVYELSFCWPCGQTTGHKICAGGEVAAATQFCSELDSQKATVKGMRSQQSGWTAEEILPFRVAKMAAACDLNGTIGGPIDAIEITTSGTIRWLRRKCNCPENTN